MQIIIFCPFAGFKCPPPDTIEPCECYSNGNVGCYFKDNIAQDSVDNLFAKLREINGVAPNEFFQLPPETGEFTLRESKIVEFDLAPLVNVSMYRIFLGDNRHLTTIKGPPLDINQRLISVKWLSLLDYGINDRGLGETLKYFNPEILTQLHLLSNNLTGSNQGNGGELLPGLWNLRNLEEIHFGTNPIKKITSKQFAPFPKLSSLRLENYFSPPEVLILEKDAFTFHPQYNEINRGRSLSIYLPFQNLNEASFNLRELGLLNYPDVAISLDLKSNKFEVLSQDNFEPFFEINEKNMLFVSSNPIMCDSTQSLKWLQDQREKYENRLPYAFCDGDSYGCTIFQAPTLTHVCKLKLQKIKDQLNTLATVIALFIG